MVTCCFFVVKIVYNKYKMMIIYVHITLKLSKIVKFKKTVSVKIHKEKEIKHKNKNLQFLAIKL